VKPKLLTEREAPKKQGSANKTDTDLQPSEHEYLVGKNLNGVAVEIQGYQLAKLPNRLHETRVRGKAAPRGGVKMGK
jgi:hypothetical protein